MMGFLTLLLTRKFSTKWRTVCLLKPGDSWPSVAGAIWLETWPNSPTRVSEVEIPSWWRYSLHTGHRNIASIPISSVARDRTSGPGGTSNNDWMLAAYFLEPYPGEVGFEVVDSMGRLPRWADRFGTGPSSPGDRASCGDVWDWRTPGSELPAWSGLRCSKSWRAQQLRDWSKTARSRLSNRFSISRLAWSNLWLSQHADTSDRVGCSSCCLWGLGWVYVHSPPVLLQKPQTGQILSHLVFRARQMRQALPALVRWYEPASRVGGPLSGDLRFREARDSSMSKKWKGTDLTSGLMQSECLHRAPSPIAEERGMRTDKMWRQRDKRGNYWGDCVGRPRNITWYWLVSRLRDANVNLRTWRKGKLV